MVPDRCSMSQRCETIMLWMFWNRVAFLCNHFSWELTKINFEARTSSWLFLRVVSREWRLRVASCRTMKITRRSQTKSCWPAQVLSTKSCRTARSSRSRLFGFRVVLGKRSNAHMLMNCSQKMEAAPPIQNELCKNKLAARLGNFISACFLVLLRIIWLFTLTSGFKQGEVKEGIL